MTNISYPTAAPVFADADHMAEIIGQASTSDEALDIYTRHFQGTGARAIKAVKVCPDRRGEGPVDGWAPEMADE